MVSDDSEFNTGVPIMRTLAFSPDGGILATGGNTRLVALWRVPDLSLLGVLDGHALGGVNCLTFSPDGSLLASGGSDTTVSIWRVADWSLLHTLPGDGFFFSVYSLAFSPDGSLLASGTYGLNFENFPGIGFVPPAQLNLWRVSDGQLFWNRTNIDKSIRALSFLADGKVLAVGNDYGDAPPGNIQFRRVSDGSLLCGFWGSWGVDESVEFRGPILDFQLTDNGSKILYAAAPTLVLARTPLCIHEIMREESRVVVRWFGGTPPFQLQQSRDLASGVWENVGPPATVRAATNALNGGAVFYRVKSLSDP